MASRLSETIPKFTAETLLAASKQSSKCYVVPMRLRRAIKRYVREQENPHMRRNVLSLTQSFNNIKNVNLQLAATTSRELIEDPQKSILISQRWKIRSSYGDVGFKYSDDQTVAYVAARMPAIFCSLYRVLSEVKRRLPGFKPVKVLDFGSGSGTAMWALREVWPRTMKKLNIVEPSQHMQRTAQSLISDLKDLPHINSYLTIQALSKDIDKSERKHDLVIASYVLGEIPSLKDRITTVRQLWDLTGDVLILVEPGSPHGASIISQMRSHILWKEKRKTRKKENASGETCKDLVDISSGAHIVAPCPHDGACPLDNTGKYCHFVQRLERTSSQRAYKKSSRGPLRGFEDEKFCYVAFRRGQRPSQPWPLDGMEFDTLKEQQAKRKPEDFEIDSDDLKDSEDDEDAEDAEYPLNKMSYNSDMSDSESEIDEIEEDDEEDPRADLGSGWGRIIYSPIRRGRRIMLDVCKATDRSGSDGSFERIVVTKTDNPKLHHQARRSLWGDLWPF